MSDRAQLHTGGMIRTLVTAGIVGTVLVIVIEEALSTPALAAGEVEQVCGLCHFEPWRIGVFLVVLGLHALMIGAYYRIGDRGEDGE
jgi:hypothetical protein